MSRIGKLPISVPKGVSIAIDGNTVRVKGPKGELSRVFAAGITIGQEGETLNVTRASDEENHKSLHGLSRSLLANMVEGVTKGFERKLEIVGVGFRAEVKGKSLVLNIGYSHPVEYAIPQGVTIAVDKAGVVTLSGIDKKQVGQAAADLRAFRKPDAYKGKGVRHQGEYIRLKAGKSAK